MKQPWVRATLSDVATVVGRGIAPKYSDKASTKVLNQRCIRGGRVNEAAARQHDAESKPVKPQKLLRIGDVLVNSTGVGTLGRTAPVRAIDGPTTADSHVTIVRPNHDTDPAWLAYALSTAESTIEEMGEGSTGQTELSRHRLASLEMEVPPLAVQHEIAATLGAIDDKIDSNSRLRGLLRSVGLANFYDAVAAAPFRLLALGELTTSIARGVAPKYAYDDESAPLVLNQKCVRDGWVTLAQARRMVDRTVAPAKRVSDGDILVNSTGVGTLGRVARWHRGSIFADGHVSVVKANRSATGPTVLAYALLERESDIEAMATGTTGQTELSPSRLATLMVELPGWLQSIELEMTLLAVEERIDALRDEDARLLGIRRTLLPELLTGRILCPEEPAVLA